MSWASTILTWILLASAFFLCLVFPLLVICWPRGYLGSHSRYVCLGKSLVLSGPQLLYLVNMEPLPEYLCPVLSSWNFSLSFHPYQNNTSLALRFFGMFFKPCRYSRAKGLASFHLASDPALDLASRAFVVTAPTSRTNWFLRWVPKDRQFIFMWLPNEAPNIIEDFSFISNSPSSIPCPALAHQDLMGLISVLASSLPYSKKKTKPKRISLKVSYISFGNFVKDFAQWHPFFYGLISKGSCFWFGLVSFVF